MINNADRTVLNETVKNTRMAVQSIETILNRVDDDDLSYELNCQEEKYKKIEKKAMNKLKDYKAKAEDDSIPQKLMLKSSIQAKTLMNNGSKHIADMMIQGSTKGITELSKVLNENKNASKSVCEIAKELVDFEEKNIERLKTYL